MQVTDKTEMRVVGHVVEFTEAEFHDLRFLLRKIIDSPYNELISSLANRYFYGLRTEDQKKEPNA